METIRLEYDNGKKCFIETYCFIKESAILYACSGTFNRNPCFWVYFGFDDEENASIPLHPDEAEKVMYRLKEIEFPIFKEEQHVTQYTFNFKDSVPFEEIDDTLMLATMAAECIHGRNQIVLDANFKATRKDNICWIDSSTEVGKDIAKIFSGFMARLFGEQSFTVERRINEPILPNVLG